MNLGNYRVIAMIGEGGFGRTYSAEHVILKEKACLKQNLSLTDADAAFLIQEARTMWNIHHHSLPVMRDFFRDTDNNCVLVMQFIDGKELQKTMTAHGALNPETVCWIAQRLLNALHYLHYKGVIHGDVKPANIIVQPDEHNAVLVDYGLAVVKPKSSTKAAGFTPVFAAPEVVNGMPPLPESDLFSLGLTLLYALGGDPRTKSIPDTVPPEITDYINKLMRHNPLDRPTWGNTDLIKTLSDIRQNIFGRRNTL